MTPMLWTEKYRPAALEDLKGRDLPQAIRNLVAGTDLPHLFLHGPAGTGKSSTVRLIRRQLYGPLDDSMVLCVNASDDRSIHAVRDAIASFSKTRRGICDWAEGAADSPCLPKLVVLEEADSLTPDAQYCLRRMMEVHATTTRFCLVCNKPDRLVEAIRSRCYEIAFAPVLPDLVRGVLASVATREAFCVPEEALDVLTVAASGDLRKAINSLQALCMLHLEDGRRCETQEARRLTGMVPTPGLQRPGLRDTARDLLAHSETWGCSPVLIVNFVRDLKVLSPGTIARCEALVTRACDARVLCAFLAASLRAP